MKRQQGKGILFVIFLIAIAIIIWQVDLNTIFSWRIFPEPTNPKEFSWQWKYKGQIYALEQTLFESYYNHYQSMPRYYRCRITGCPDNWEEDYFKMFLRVHDKDDTFSVLAKNLFTLAEKNNLSKDETAELILAFVQNIPYDWEKAELDSVFPEYPYEVLYNNKAVCSGKTFLAILLFKELGFGTAMFQFPNQEHIAPAVRCPLEYSSYNSGFCFAEATSVGHKIGEVPRMAVGSPVPEARARISDFGTGITEYSKLQSPEIYVVNNGLEYKGIIETARLAKEIENLENRLEVSKRELDELKITLDGKERIVNDLNARAQMTYRRYADDSSNQELYLQYEKEYQEYLKAFQEYRNVLRIYNEKIADFNRLAKEYNLSLEDFYR